MPPEKLSHLVQSDDIDAVDGLNWCCLSTPTYLIAFKPFFEELISGHIPDSENFNPTPNIFGIPEITVLDITPQESESHFINFQDVDLVDGFDWCQLSSLTYPCASKPFSWKLAWCRLRHSKEFTPKLMASELPKVPILHVITLQKNPFSCGQETILKSF